MSSGNSIELEELQIYKTIYDTTKYQSNCGRELKIFNNVGSVEKY